MLTSENPGCMNILCKLFNQGDKSPIAKWIKLYRCGVNQITSHNKFCYNSFYIIRSQLLSKFIRKLSLIFRYRPHYDLEMRILLAALLVALVVPSTLPTTSLHKQTTAPRHLNLGSSQAFSSTFSYCGLFSSRSIRCA